MTEKIQWKNIFLAAKNEYAKWLFDPKMILLFAAFLPYHDLYVKPFLHASDIMNSPVNLLEPCIAAMTAGIIPLTIIYLILIAGFPTSDGNTMMYVSRMGRRNWILGEILFQIFSILTYNLIIISVFVLQVFKQSFFANGWSLVVTDFDTLYPDEPHLKGILPPNIYFQLPPWKAFGLAVLLFSLLLFTCGMIFLLGCLYQKRLLFFVLHLTHIVLGLAMLTLHSQAMWFFPVAHAVLSFHYQEYFRKYVFPPWLSILLYVIVLFMACIAVYRKAVHVSIDLLSF